MKTLISALFLLTAALPAQGALRCESVFTERTSFLLISNRSQSTADSVESFFRHQDRELYFRVDTPQKETSGTVLLIHGLGDHSGRLNTLTDQLIDSGRRVVRVDLHGHGRTLRQRIEKEQWSEADEVPFAHQVEDVSALIAHLGLKDFTLIGHSYGGGVATAVASKLAPQTSTTSPVREMILLAPFVMDLRSYYQSGLLARQAVWNRVIHRLRHNPIAQDMAQAGRSMMDRYFIDGLIDIVDLYRRGAQLGIPDHLTPEAQMERATERYMKKTYRTYFEHLAKQEGLLDHPDFERTLDVEIMSSIRATQGISKYSLFDSSHALWSPAVKTTIVAGKTDGLVPLDLLKKTVLHLENKGVHIELLTADSGHLIPQSVPEAIIPLLKSDLPTN